MAQLKFKQETVEVKFPCYGDRHAELDYKLNLDIRERHGSMAFGVYDSNFCDNVYLDEVIQGILGYSGLPYAEVVGIGKLGDVNYSRKIEKYVDTEPASE